MAKIMIWAGAVVSSVSLYAGKPVPPPEKMPHPGKRALPEKGKPKWGMRGNAIMWRVFSQLDDGERKRLQTLQRNNPEQFTAEMRKLAEKYEKQERAWYSKMTFLIEKYRKSTDKEERSKLKAEIARMEKVRFDQRVAGLERTIAGAKRRVAMMERELEKRRTKAAAIIEARVEALLAGEIPVMPHPPRGHRPPRPPHPPRH